MPKNKLQLADVWNVSDPRDVPAYSIAESANYLCMPKATLRSWVLGTSYTQNGERKQFKHVIDLPHPESHLLSFFNLAEAHVLRAFRTEHTLLLPKIRKALTYVSKQFGWKRPLIQQEFKTDGIDLFVDQLGKLIDASAKGQIVMKDVMMHLARIEWEDNIAARLYPFTRSRTENAPMSVIIDPRFSFGRPILRESRIATAVIAERYKAGESITALAEDYGCTQLEIEEGVRCELRLNTAA